MKNAIIFHGTDDNPDRYWYKWLGKELEKDGFINSVNDPWNCNDTQGRMMFDNLGGTQVILNDGHFGSLPNGQKYDTFPFLRTIVLGDTHKP